MKDERVVHIVVSGHPVAKGRGRAISTPHGPRVYTPSKTRNYEQDVRQEARRVMENAEPIYAPCRVTFDAVVPPGSSWPKWMREAAENGQYQHTSPPDVDNLVKAAQDGLNGIVFADDAQIFDMRIRKSYGWTPRIEVVVEAVPEPENAQEWKNWIDTYSPLW